MLRRSRCVLIFLLKNIYIYVAMPGSQLGSDDAATGGTGDEATALLGVINFGIISQSRE